MAKGYKDISFQVEDIISDIKKGSFSPVYLLMGEESYYVDLVLNLIVENALEESERDFNQTIVYGADVNAEAVTVSARRYPMFATRQLVVLKEAQMMKTIEDLSHYCAKPLASTVFVIAMHGSRLDKRKALYKAINKVGVVLDSVPVKDYELDGWIRNYYRSRGLNIRPDAAALLAEHAGAELTKITIETDKLLKNVPEGTVDITAEIIEKNVGISRQFSVFELTKELSYRNSSRALKIAAHMGASPKFVLLMVTSALFMHFHRILKYHALLERKEQVSFGDRARLLGVNSYFMDEYDKAIRNYPLFKTMTIIDLIKRFDYKAKGGDVGDATDSELLMELVTKILTI